jgi:uncharacterized damage-inducible protein DinB
VGSAVEFRDAVLATWRTSNRVTVYLVENLPAEVWSAQVPGMPGRTVRMIAGHMHNARCMWIKTLGGPQGVTVPTSVDRRRVTRAQLVRALRQSDRSMIRLLELGLDHNGRIPLTSAAWVNFPLDVVHVLSYFVAHEGHHRGQIIMIARQLGQRLPAAVTAGVWQFTKRAKEAREG